MKKEISLYFLLCLLFSGALLAQNSDPYRADLTPVFSNYKNGNQLIGYKGRDGKRLKIVFADVHRSDKDLARYLVQGKTLFDNKITDFTGIMSLLSLNGEPDAELYTNEQGEPYYFMTGRFKCVLKDKHKDPKTGGVYEGLLTFYCGLGKNGTVVQDDQVNVGDGESNFIFDGTWTSYTAGEIKPVKWGQYRLSAPIGHMGDDGMFYIDVKDPENKLGWETYRKAYQLSKQDSVALKEELKIWWQ